MDTVSPNVGRNYGWVMVFVAAAAMVGTLPGRTQGLGLITEPLLRDLKLDRLDYANLNLWATLLGALFCFGVGALQDRIGTRAVLTTIAVALGAVVVGMSRLTDAAALLPLLILTRGFGQSALSVVALALVGKWFRTGLDRAMAVFSVVMSMGFMIAFPVMGEIIKKSGWRVAWGGLGLWLILVLAPLALAFARPEPGRESARGPGSEPGATKSGSFTLSGALRTPAFWAISVGAALYGLVASGIGLFNESILNERGFAAGTYYNSLVVTALTTLVGNFLGGFLARRGSMNRLMAVALALLSVGLVSFPHLSTLPQVIAISVVMGIAGGFVMVLFFGFYGAIYGPENLGRIQGVAQAITVVASALGPVALAAWAKANGSYAGVFYLLAEVVVAAAVAAALTPMPRAYRASASPDR